MREFVQEVKSMLEELRNLIPINKYTDIIESLLYSLGGRIGEEETFT